MAGLDEPVGLEEQIKSLQRQIEEMKRQHQDEQLQRREAIKGQPGDIKSLQADERQERKRVIEEQIEEIKQLHKEQQERQKALLEEMVEMKQLEQAERNANKKGLRLGFALKLGKQCGKDERTKDLEFLQDRGDVEARKGFLKLHILDVLTEGPSHGYEIMHRISHYTGSPWTPSPGSMYPALDALETKGFISRQGDGRRKVYSLTPKGQNVLDEITKKRNEMFQEMKAFMSALFDE